MDRTSNRAAVIGLVCTLLFFLAMAWAIYVALFMLVLAARPKRPKPIPVAVPATVHVEIEPGDHDYNNCFYNTCPKCVDRFGG